jgi:hypothetical protein
MKKVGFSQHTIHIDELKIGLEEEIELSEHLQSEPQQPCVRRHKQRIGSELSLLRREVSNIGLAHLQGPNE